MSFQVKDQADNKQEIFRTQYEVIRPQIRRIQDIQKYFNEAASLIVQVLESMAKEYQYDGFPSEDFLFMLAKTFDIYVDLDILKNSKTSMTNDFSIYKRICSTTKNSGLDIENDEEMDSTEIYQFLGNKNVLANALKENLFDVKRRKGTGSSSKSKDKNSLEHVIEDILVDLVNSCMKAIELHEYLKPSEKYMNLKAMALALFLLDINSEDSEIHRKRRLKLDKAIKIIRQKPVVPSFGDLSFALASLFARSPRLSQMHLLDGIESDETLDKSYRIIFSIDKIRNDYESYCLDFKFLMNIFKSGANNPEKISANDINEYYDLLFRGVNLLSKMTSRVLEQSAWKYFKPCRYTENESCPKDAKPYELAVRYNYTEEEKFALVECIGMIKNLSNMLLNVKTDGISAIYDHIQDELHQFATHSLKDMLHLVAKRKRPILSIVQHIYGLITGGVKVDNSGSNVDLSNIVASNAKTIDVSFTQLRYIRCLLFYATNERSKGMQGGLMKNKDFKESHVNESKEFLEKSRFFTDMIDFDNSVRECADISELWYKELYLDIAKEIQFPIEMSLPWILAKSVLESDQPELYEYALYPFEIYNDAANRALRELKTKFLYDEIVAEVNLCLIQFVFEVSELIFVDTKSRASLYMLDKELKKEWEKSKKLELKPKYFMSVIEQKNFQLLGRSVNMSQLIAESCNKNLRNSIDVAIMRFESCGLSNVMELERLLTNCELTWKLLTDYGLKLEPFKQLFDDVNLQSALIDGNNRILNNTMADLENYFFSNYSYNSVSNRFIKTSKNAENSSRSQIPKNKPAYLYGTKALYAANNASLDLFRNYFGSSHVSALVKILGAKNLYHLMGQLLNYLENVINNSLSPYLKVLFKAMPHSTKLPPVEYGAAGCFDYFQLILDPIFKYPDLRSGVYQSFKEIGNCLVFVFNIDLELRKLDIMNDITASTLTGDAPNLTVSHSQLVVKNVMEKCDPEAMTPLKNQGNQIYQLYGKHKKTEFMGKFLKEFKNIIQKKRPSLELTTSTKNEILVESSNEFYRLWCVLQFTMSVPPYSENEPNIRKAFGDAMIWSGVTLIELLEEKNLFEAFDFVKYLCYVRSLETEEIRPTRSGINYVEAFKLANWINHMDEEVFNLLEKIQRTG